MNRKKRAVLMGLATGTALLPTLAHAAISGFSGFAPDNSNVTSTNIGYSADGSTFELTDGGGSEATSGFYLTPQDITSFSASFIYQTPGLSNTSRTQYANADGFTFIVQDDSRGTAALGGTGGGKGYTSGAPSITPSAAIGYEMYGGQTYSYYQNGSTITSNSSNSIPILNTGHPIQVNVTYRDNILNTSFIDMTNKSSVYLSQTNVNLPSLLGSSTAYIGFGGGTGGAASTQTIKNFTYTPGVGNLSFTTPLNVTGFNQDMVVEAGASQTGASANVTATMDAGTSKTGATYYEMGYNPSNTSTGLPASGSTFTSQADHNHVFTMQSYTANNALMLTTGTPTGTLTLATPVAMNAVSVLAAVGNGVAPFILTVNYANGTSITMPYDTETPDWFFQAPAAWDTMGRAYPNSGATTYDNVGNNEPNLYQLDIPLTDTNDPVSSFTFQFDGTGGNLAIFAVSAAVPEPATVGLLTTAAATALLRRRRRA